MSADRTLSRRDFVKTGATVGAGLVLGIHLPGRNAVTLVPGGPGLPAELAPNAWLRIGADGLVTIVVDEAEMGQGVRTGLPMVMAEELEADWSTVRVAPPPTDPSSWLRNISTGGSTSIRLGWEPFRKAGAAAREMLRRAAAEAWGVEVSACRAREGRIHGPGGRSLGYGELAERAAALPVPDDPPLKDPSEFRIVGTVVPRRDQSGRVEGTAVFGTDVRVEGMRMAVVARPRAFGAELVRFDAAPAMEVDGVEEVFAIEEGVAVVARSTWAALRGRDALSVEWSDPPRPELSSEWIRRRARELADTPGTVERSEGDPDAALEGADRRHSAVYEAPFLDHATMEPMNCTARVRGDRVEVWAPTQVVTAAQETAAEVAGVPVERVVLHSVLIGGGFGRRLQTDYVKEAVQIAMQVEYPVQLFWDREDTTRHGAYRPYTHHRIEGALGDDGRPTAWAHRIVGPPPQGVTTGGAAAMPYRIPNVRLDYHLDDWGVPVGAWRSVGNTQNGFVTESFVDELAHLAGRDPYRFRRSLLPPDSRLRTALDLAAERAGWDRPAPEGRARGIAAVSCFGSHVAEVAEVSVSPEGQVRVHRVVCGVDCGQPVNPDLIRAQMEGGVTLALTATLKGAITLDRGRVREGNFHDYPLLQITEMPEVEVHFVPEYRDPGGIGEPGVPPLPPAVANAVFAATGTRVRRLPMTPEEVTAAG